MQSPLLQRIAAIVKQYLEGCITAQECADAIALIMANEVEFK